MSFVKRFPRLTAGRLLYLLVVLLPVCLLVYAFFTRTQVSHKPKAVNGVLDLSDWDVEKQGAIPLNGQWSFYWNQLLEPNDFISATPKPTGSISVPGIWNGYALEKTGLPASGYATYVLDVKIHSPGKPHALNLLTVSNAYKLWVNDELIAANGTVGTNDEQSKPAYRPQVVVFTPQSEHVRFVMQVSNFAHCKGGFWLPVEMGAVTQIQEERDKRVLMEMFLFGSLFIMAMYHFTLYFMRRKDPSTLYFGLMCAAIGIRSLLTGTNLINHIFPGLDWFLARKIEYVLTFVSVPVYVTFSRILYPAEWNRKVYRVIVGFGLALCLFVLVTPSRMYTNTSYVFTGFAWLTSIVTIFVFTKAARNKQEGAGIFLATSLFFLLTIVNDTLNQLEIVHTGLYLSFGLLIVTFAQSFVLATRSANAFRQTEIYASTFRKFVPMQFLGKIAKDGIGSIRPGNAVKENVTVLFSDIRSFTSISEAMTADEVFHMLNKYLSYVEPPIRANNGFVDKYMGDGIMALFENSPGDNSAHNAVLAALDMQLALERYNEHRHAASKQPLRMGIGLHAGPVIIGTLGGNERMDSTAIGDAVNLASRIEGMTKMYGVNILVSEDTIRLLHHAGEEFLLRYVDTVMAKGKHEPARIWEIIGKRSDQTLAKQAAMLPVFEDAMRHYEHKQMAVAKKNFEHCLALCPGDPVSEIYLERCLKFLETGTHAGVTNQEVK